MLEEVQTMADGKIISETGLPQEAEHSEGGEDAVLYDKAVRIVTETRRARFPVCNATCASATTAPHA